MKKFTLIVTALALVFAVGVVYADESMPIATDMRSIVQDDNITYAALDNGVTFVGMVEPGIKCFSEGGEAAGGMAVSKELRKAVQDDRFTYTALDNGVSFAAEIPTLTCSWARGLDLDLHNGISVPGGTVDQ